MALKAVLDSLDGLDEAQKALYKQHSSGKFVLDLDGVPIGFTESSKLDEFRNNNVQLKQDIETLKQAAAQDAEKLSKLAEMEKRLENDEEAKLIADGKIDEVIQRRLDKQTSEMRRELEGKIKNGETVIETLTGERDEAVNGFNNLRIDTSINEAINEHGGVRKGALQDIRSRARNIFKMKDGIVTAMDADGNIVYGPSGGDSMSPLEYVNKLVEDAPHLFEDSSGGGGPGKKGGDKPKVGMRSIARGDIAGFGKNLEAIAKGEVTVGG